MFESIEEYQIMALASWAEVCEPIFSCLDVRRSVFIGIFNCEDSLDGLTRHESTSIDFDTMQWKAREECLINVLKKNTSQ